MSENSERYPDRQQEYCQTVGKLLPRIIAQILTDLGFRVWVNDDQTNGVDLQVFDEDNLIFVAEIINWSPFSRMSEKRKNWITSNLSKSDCRKVFLYTVFENEDILDDFGSLEIFLLRIGYQVLPEEYYLHYAEKKQLIDRRIDCEETRKDIRSKMMNFLWFIGILDLPIMLGNEILVTE